MSRCRCWKKQSDLSGRAVRPYSYSHPGAAWARDGPGGLLRRAPASQAPPLRTSVLAGVLAVLCRFSVKGQQGRGSLGWGSLQQAWGPGPGWLPPTSTRSEHRLVAAHTLRERVVQPRAQNRKEVGPGRREDLTQGTRPVLKLRPVSLVKNRDGGPGSLCRHSAVTC